MPEIIFKDTLTIAGVRGDGARTAALWEAFERLELESPHPAKADGGGYELRTYTRDSACECLVGIAVRGAAEGCTMCAAYETAALPAGDYASFDLYPAKGYTSENTAIDAWLRDNGEWEQVTANGRAFILEYYGPRFRGPADPGSVVELWVPVKRRGV